ncbi:MAG: hypothetical protein ACTHOH_15500 [Lysobacteraceae bacterium]
MLIIDAVFTRWQAGNGSATLPIANRIAWRSHAGQRRLLAVGDDTQRAGAPPLPADAIETDLVRIASTEPRLALEFWSAFLAYVLRGARRSPFARLVAMLSGEPVRLRIDDPASRDAVRAVLARVRRPRLRFVEG